MFLISLHNNLVGLFVFFLIVFVDTLFYFYANNFNIVFQGENSDIALYDTKFLHDLQHKLDLLAIEAK